MMRFIRRMLSPYRAVVIDSDGDRFEHRAMTSTDALEWLACYPDGIGIVYTRSGRINALRIA